jgi:hemoglobin
MSNVMMDKFILAARRLAACIAVACIALAASNAFSQTATDDALYLKLGGQPGLVRLMDDFMARLIADPRMNPFFKAVDQKHLKEQLVLQFCEVSGGPCRRNGPDMKTAHSEFDIGKNDFNALVEVLQHSMDAQGIGFATQNLLLAKLAPMHRDIVNTP